MGVSKLRQRVIRTLFETGINVWLQSIGSPVLSALLSGVSLLGYLPVYAVVIPALAFGVRLRPGLAVLGAVLLTGLVTEAAKEAVAFPRPDQVDDRLVRTRASGGEAIVRRGGAPDFWSLPAAAAIEEVRARARGNYGFPSGHVSAATAFLLGAAWFLRSRPVYAFAALWVPLMALSRMYLGRHFLADVLGGFVIALAVCAAWIRFFPATDPVDGTWPDRHALRGLWLLSLSLVALTPFSPLLEPRYVGTLAGLALSYSEVVRAGAPPDGGAWRLRLTRVVLALTLFSSSFGLTEGLLMLAGRSGGRLSGLFLGAMVTGSTFAGGVYLCRRLRLYEAS